jgi:hypothetical protein
MFLIGITETSGSRGENLINLEEALGAPKK